MTAKSRTNRIAELGGRWLEKVPESDNWYITSYDKASRQTRRVSTGSSDLEAAIALLRLLAFSAGISVRDAIKASGKNSAGSLGEILDWHYVTHASKLVSSEAQRIGSEKIKKIMGHKQADALVPSDFEIVRRQFEAEGLSIGYLSRILSTVRNALNRAHDDRKISRPVKVPEFRKKAHKEAAPNRGGELQLHQMARLWDAADELHVRIFIILALHTGGRPSALLELRAEQIDRLLNLNPPGRVQTKKRRPSLPVPSTLWPWLECPGGDHLITYRGEPIRSIKTGFKAACRRAGLASDINPYSIRHMLGRQLRQRGVGSEEISVFLGHVLPSVKQVTLTYSPYDPGFLRNATQAIEDVVREVQSLAKRSLTTPPWEGQ